MSGRRTNKHRSSNERFDDKLAKVVKSVGSTVIKDGEPCFPVDRLKYLVNMRIDMDPTIDLKHAVRLLEATNKEYGIDRKVTPCSCCAKKIGVSQCAGCPRSVDTRYCSKECQLADWPAHKATCGGHAVVDID